MGVLRRLLRDERGGGRSTIVGSVVAATILIGGYAAVQGGGGGDTITCNHSSVDASDLTSDITAASNGQTICLVNAVDYGTFSGTTKNLTIVAQEGGSGAENPVDATLAISMGSGDTGTVVIDGGMDTWDSPEGLNIKDAVFVTGAANLTVRDFEIDPSGEVNGECPFFGRCWVFDPAPINSNILVDHCYAHDGTDGEAIFYIDDGASSGDTGIIVQNCLFEHMSNDGMKLTGDETVTVRNNKFTDMHGSYDVAGEENHTDAIQMLAGNHIIYGNWLTATDQCLFSDDGTENNTVHHNLIDNCGQHFITISSDNPGSTIYHNTITSRTQDIAPYFECGTNFGAGAESQPDLQNNIFQEMNLGGTNGGPNCVPTANHHNMLKVGESTTGTGGSNFTGTQTYVGGSDLSTFDEFSDFCLSDGTAGEDDATDGSQVGICGGDYNGTNYGPPSGEGF